MPLTTFHFSILQKLIRLPEKDMQCYEYAMKFKKLHQTRLRVNESSLKYLKNPHKGFLPNFALILTL